eukprot:scaffold6240_cov14-Tisochrysis_lutea.AAC.2
MLVVEGQLVGVNLTLLQGLDERACTQCTSLQFFNYAQYSILHKLEAAKRQSKPEKGERNKGNEKGNIMQAVNTSSVVQGKERDSHRHKGTSPRQ